MKLEFEKFIEGKTIDLCIATEDIALNSDWYKWFNDKAITRYLLQGKFPNTREAQKNFFIKETASKNRLLLLIVTKDLKLKGVISLSKIDFENRSADLALVVDNKISTSAKLCSLEAVALITAHGFEELRLDRIYARQNRALEGWQKRMELLGYCVEGIHEDDFYESREFTNSSVSIACTYKNYKIIIDHRGTLFDSEDDMIKRIKNLPKKSFAAALDSFLQEGHEKYYSSIWFS